MTAIGATGCLSSDDVPETGTEAVVPRDATGYYTNPDATGNRFVQGQGSLRESDRVTIDTDGVPRWLVAVPTDTGSRWTVVTEDGSVSRWGVGDGEATREEGYERLPRGYPPLVTRKGEKTRLVRPPEGMPVTATPTVAGGDPPKLLYVNERGDLVVGKNSSRSTESNEDRNRSGSVEKYSFGVDSIPDARIAEVDGGRYALFGDATDRYRHGALGDRIEGSTLVIYDSEKDRVSKTELPRPDVFEGLGPMAADVDGDGDREIVTTVANSTEGARIAVFGPDGGRIATGPVHEPGWRHQLAVAPFGAEGGAEIAVVRKPHVDKVLEFYSLRGGSLEVVSTLGGFQSHTYGSRNLGGAVAADADKDGSTELLVPTAERDEIAAVRRTPEGTEVVWEKELEGVVTSNITGVSLGDGISIGVADESGVHVWQG
jgi:hypothetical protein